MKTSESMTRSNVIVAGQLPFRLGWSPLQDLLEPLCFASSGTVQALANFGPPARQKAFHYNQQAADHRYSCCHSMHCYASQEILRRGTKCRGRLASSKERMRGDRIVVDQLVEILPAIDGPCDKITRSNHTTQQFHPCLIATCTGTPLSSIISVPPKKPRK